MTAAVQERNSFARKVSSGANMGQEETQEWTADFGSCDQKQGVSERERGKRGREIDTKDPRGSIVNAEGECFPGRKCR